MSAIEAILFRAMSDTDFAGQLFTDPEKALAGYSLTVDEFAKFKKISQTRFKTMVTDQRKSLSMGSTSTEGGWRTVSGGGVRIS